MDNRVTDKSVEKEKCVLCGVETDIPRDLHIDFRYGYIEGVGQLCKSCALQMDA